MTVYKVLDLYGLQDEAYSDKLDTLIDSLNDDTSLEGAVSRYVHDLDDAESDIENHFVDIVRDYCEIAQVTLTTEVIESLGLTWEQCREAKIPVELEHDESGRKFVLVPENPAQMSFLDGGRVRKYLEG